MSEATRFRESPDAQQLADALRTRYTTRREQPDGDELSADLRRLGDIEAIPAVAKPGVTAAPMKAARAVLRVLLRPWLAVQTQTNHEVARRLQRLSSDVSGLLRRTPDVEESLQQLEARLREIERRAASSSLPSAAQSGAADLERMFVHMHLGRPPARVLVLESPSSMVNEIAAFGFEVSRSHPDEAGTPSATPADSVGTTAGDAAFDVVIALSDDQGWQTDIGEAVRAAARVLRSGGVLLGAWTPEALSGAEASWRGLFEPRVIMSGEPSGSGWQVREQQSVDASATPQGDRRSIVMIQALRRDAPDR
jgi:hypothetical protein